jgi:hypothetical protein
MDPSEDARSRAAALAAAGRPAPVWEHAGAWCGPRLPASAATATRADPQASCAYAHDNRRTYEDHVNELSRGAEDQSTNWFKPVMTSACSERASMSRSTPSPATSGAPAGRIDLVAGFSGHAATAQPKGSSRGASWPNQPPCPLPCPRARKPPQRFRAAAPSCARAADRSCRSSGTPQARARTPRLGQPRPETERPPDIHLQWPRVLLMVFSCAAVNVGLGATALVASSRGSGAAGGQRRPASGPYSPLARAAWPLP